MAADLTSADVAAHERASKKFYTELEAFHLARGTPFKRPPLLGGRPIDLYLLYKKVVSLGGWVAVTENRRWREVVKLFELPPSCTNAAFVLRQHYMRYLDAYEQIHHFGHHSDGEEDQNEDESCGAAIAPDVRQPEQAAAISERRRSSGCQSRATPLSELSVLRLSLLSGFPNESDVALNTCLLLSRESPEQLCLSNVPDFLEILLAHAGVFCHQQLSSAECSRLGEVAERMTSLWRHSVCCEYRPNNLDVDNRLESDEGEPCCYVLDTWAVHRVAVICTILLNLLQTESNAEYLAKSKVFARFLTVTMHCSVLSVQYLAMEAAVEVSHQFVLDHGRCRDRCRLQQRLFDLLLSSDRAAVQHGLHALAGLCAANSDECFTEHFPRQCMQRLFALLTAPDVQLITGCLETLVSISGLGRSICTALVDCRGSLSVLVSLLTFDMESALPLEALQCVRLCSEAVAPVVLQPTDTEGVAAAWLRAHYELSSDSMCSRNQIYNEYAMFCAVQLRQPLAVLQPPGFWCVLARVFSSVQGVGLVFPGSRQIADMHLHGLARRSPPARLHFTAPVGDIGQTVRGGSQQQGQTVVLQTKQLVMPDGAVVSIPSALQFSAPGGKVLRMPRAAPATPCPTTSAPTVSHQRTEQPRAMLPGASEPQQPSASWLQKQLLQSAQLVKTQLAPGSDRTAKSVAAGHLSPASSQAISSDASSKIKLPVTLKGSAHLSLPAASRPVTGQSLLSSTAQGQRQLGITTIVNQVSLPVMTPSVPKVAQQAVPAVSHASSTVTTSRASGTVTNQVCVGALAQSSVPAQGVTSHPVAKATVTASKPAQQAVPPVNHAGGTVTTSQASGTVTNQVGVGALAQSSVVALGVTSHPGAKATVAASKPAHLAASVSMNHSTLAVRAATSSRGVTTSVAKPGPAVAASHSGPTVQRTVENRSTQVSNFSSALPAVQSTEAEAACTPRPGLSAMSTTPKVSSVTATQAQAVIMSTVSSSGIILTVPGGKITCAAPQMPLALLPEVKSISALDTAAPPPGLRSCSALVDVAAVVPQPATATSSATCTVSSVARAPPLSTPSHPAAALTIAHTGSSLPVSSASLNSNQTATSPSSQPNSTVLGVATTQLAARPPVLNSGALHAVVRTTGCSVSGIDTSVARNQQTSANQSRIGSANKAHSSVSLASSCVITSTLSAQGLSDSGSHKQVLSASSTNGDMILPAVGKRRRSEESNDDSCLPKKVLCTESLHKPVQQSEISSALLSGKQDSMGVNKASLENHIPPAENVLVNGIGSESAGSPSSGELPGCKNMLDAKLVAASLLASRPNGDIANHLSFDQLSSGSSVLSSCASPIDSPMESSSAVSAASPLNSAVDVIAQPVSSRPLADMLNVVHKNHTSTSSLSQSVLPDKCVHAAVITPVDGSLRESAKSGPHSSSVVPVLPSANASGSQPTSAASLNAVASSTKEDLPTSNLGVKTSHTAPISSNIKCPAQSLPALKTSAESTSATITTTLKEASVVQSGDVLRPQGKSQAPKKAFPCCWKDCAAAYDDSQLLLNHAIAAHVPQVGRSAVCLWDNCSASSKARRRPNLLHHLKAHIKNQQSGKAPASSLGEAALLSKSTWSAMLERNEEYALSATVHLSAALVLKNLAEHSTVARQFLCRHEPLLADIAMSTSEASGAITACLAFLQSENA